MNEREFVARQFEQCLAPEKIDENLVARAHDHFNALVLEYGASESVSAVLGTEADATLLVRAVLKRAVERAARETADALRTHKI